MMELKHLLKLFLRKSLTLFCLEKTNVSMLARTSLTMITFGIAFWDEKYSITLDVSMTSADLSGKSMGNAGAMILAAFLPKM